MKTFKIVLQYDNTFDEGLMQICSSQLTTNWGSAKRQNVILLKIGQFANNHVHKKYFSLNLEMLVIILFAANLFKIPIN